MLQPAAQSTIELWHPAISSANGGTNNGGGWGMRRYCGRVSRRGKGATKVTSGLCATDGRAPGVQDGDTCAIRIVSVHVNAFAAQIWVANGSHRHASPFSLGRWVGVLVSTCPRIPKRIGGSFVPDR
jgi:hypothetical protein